MARPKSNCAGRSLEVINAHAKTIELPTTHIRNDKAGSHHRSTFLNLEVLRRSKTKHLSVGATPYRQVDIRLVLIDRLQLKVQANDLPSPPSGRMECAGSSSLFDAISTYPPLRNG